MKWKFVNTEINLLYLSWWYDFLMIENKCFFFVWYKEKGSKCWIKFYFLLMKNLNQSESEIWYKKKKTNNNKMISFFNNIFFKCFVGDLKRITKKDELKVR